FRTVQGVLHCNAERAMPLTADRRRHLGADGEKRRVQLFLSAHAQAQHGHPVRPKRHTVILLGS
ncbi:MAG: hypothetical protein J2P54_15960, partial [Bradyrhizobiaceae bacterium]|nr:hypothetical protein [Bradyrhizobiaceae bacterium]